MLLLYSFSFLSAAIPLSPILWFTHQVTGTALLVLLGTLNFLAGLLLGFTWFMFFVIPNVLRFAIRSKASQGVISTTESKAVRYSHVTRVATVLMTWLPTASSSIGQEVKIYTRRFGLFARFRGFCFVEPRETTIYSEYLNFEDRKSDLFWYLFRDSAWSTASHDENIFVILLVLMLAMVTGPVRLLSSCTRRVWNLCYPRDIDSRQVWLSIARHRSLTFQLSEIPLSALVVVCDSAGRKPAEAYLKAWTWYSNYFPTLVQSKRLLCSFLRI